MNEHLSEEQITNWLIGEQTLEQHVRECPKCAASIGSTENSFILFRNALTASRADAHAHSRPPGRIWLSFATASLAAAVLILHTTPPQPQPEAQFVQIPFVAPLAPYERAEIQLMEIQVASLMAAGFDVQLADPVATVPAEVLVGQDGSPRAIRFLENPIVDNNQEN